jgi:5-formyltetrahydrofolate cyclo-ligase
VPFAESFLAIVSSQEVASGELKNFQVPNLSIREHKALLRQQCRDRRMADAATASQAIVGHFLSRLHQQPARQTIALFLPLPGEPDVTSLLATAPDRRYVFPRVIGKGMEFHHLIDITSQTTAGPWGLREPLASCPVVPIEQIDIMLCPGVAFSYARHRLGKGAGFYDRYLAQTSSHPELIGVTFDHLLFEELPHEEHDILMHDVLTEKGFASQKGASSSLQ